MALLSVIVPVYNVEEYLAECLDSVLQQTYKEMEIIVVDDGSTDRSGDICDEYALKDSRILVIHQANEGLSGARNTGLRRCRGAYITFIDSDDRYDTTDTLERNIRLLDTDNSVDLVQFSYIQSNRLMRKCVFDNIVLHSKHVMYEYFFSLQIFPTVWNKIYRASVLKNLYFVPGMYYEDELFTSAVIGRAKGILLSNVGTYYYRMRPTSIVMSGKTDKKNKDHFYNRVNHLLIALREIPNHSLCHFNIICDIFIIYLENPVCRTYYREQQYRVLDYIPQISCKTKGGLPLLICYYLYRVLGNIIAPSLVSYLKKRYKSN